VLALSSCAIGCVSPNAGTPPRLDGSVGLSDIEGSAGPTLDAAADASGAGADADAQVVTSPDTGVDRALDTGADLPFDLGADAPQDLSADTPPDVGADLPFDAGADLPFDVGADAPPDAPPDAPVLRENGTACATAEQCKSAICADGVCCGAACGGQCEACDVAGSVGTCKPVTGAPHRGGQPARAACGGDPACPGACDGTTTTRCAYPANRCRSRSCSNVAAEVINEASCDANGVCPPLTTTVCTHVCLAGNCTACTPGTRMCATPTTPQLCNNAGVWQDQSCPPAGNMQPVCAPDGSCGHQCETGASGPPAPLACGVCPLWNFETGGTDGWVALPGGAWDGSPVQSVKKQLGASNSNVLAVKVSFTPQASQLIVQLRLCAPPGLSISGRTFSYRVWMDGPTTASSFNVYPRAINGGDTDTPNGLSGLANQWIVDSEGFFQSSTVDLQLIVAYYDPAGWQGTVYFDDIAFQ
jgi:hypothetical protein